LQLAAVPPPPEEGLPAALEEAATRPPVRGGRRLPHLPRLTRLGFYVAGWGLVAVGLVGFVLPGIQGVLTLLAGLAVLSVVSRTAHGWTRATLRRWPSLLRRVERLRWRLRRRFGRRRPAAVLDPEVTDGR
jgi:hypothetical protein